MLLYYSLRKSKHSDITSCRIRNSAKVIMLQYSQNLKLCPILLKRWHAWSCSTNLRRKCIFFSKKTITITKCFRKTKLGEILVANYDFKAKTEPPNIFEIIRPCFPFLSLPFQFVIFKPLIYCFKETIGFDVKASLATRPVSHLISYNKPGDITKELWEKAIQFHGTFHGLKITNCFCRV